MPFYIPLKPTIGYFPQLMLIKYPMMLIALTTQWVNDLIMWLFFKFLVNVIEFFHQPIAAVPLLKAVTVNNIQL